jgi:hypothetical protein
MVSTLSKDQSQLQIIKALCVKCLSFLSSFTQTRHLSTDFGKNIKYEIPQHLLRNGSSVPWRGMEEEQIRQTLFTIAFSKASENEGRKK